MGHERVGVAFDDHGPPALSHRVARPIDEVQRAALVEERGCGRVEVLGAAIALRGPRRPVPGVLQDPAAQPGGVARGVADGEDDPAAEAVVDPSPPPADAQADRLQLVVGCVPLPSQCSRERLPAFGRVPELIRGDRVVREPATAEVIEGGLAVTCAGEDGVVEGDRRLEDFAEAPLPGVLARRPLVELDAGSGGQEPERGREIDSLALHDEAEDVSPQAAAEAVPALASGRHHERWSALTMERAQALPRRARLSEGDALADDLDDVELRLDGGDDACGQGTSRATRRSAASACLEGPSPSPHQRREPVRWTPSAGRHSRRASPRTCIGPCQVLTRHRGSE